MPADGDQNLPPFGSFTGSDFDIVSLQNGNLHISIPLIEVAERGGKKSSYKYIYDTPNYVLTFFPPAVPPKSGNAYFTVKPDVSYNGWRLASPFYWGTTLTYTTIICYKGEQQQHNSQWQFYAFSDPEGVKHPFGVGINPDTDGCVSPQTDAAPALDGSGMFLDMSSGGKGLILKDGSTVTEDSNGNVVYNGSSSACNSVTCPDTLNRVLLTPTNGPKVTFTTPLGKKTSPPSPQYLLLAYADSNGAQQNFRIDYEAIDVSTGLCGPITCYDYASKPTVVPSKFTLPNGTFYQFTWVNNSGAQLQQVQLPTGGSISYTYTPALVCLTSGLQAMISPAGVPGETASECRMEVKSRTVTLGSSSATWNYNSGTVTDPYGNDEVHEFTYINPPTNASVETQVSYYSGSSTSGTGTLLKTVATTYGYDYGVGGKANIRPIQKTVTLDNGQSSTTTIGYETFQANVCYSTTGGIGVACSSEPMSRMNATSVSEYDFSGALIRTTNYTYLHQSNQTYANLNIVDRVAQKTVLDGSGKQIAQTTYEYDNYGHANQPMVASGAVEHDSNFTTSYTTRGNVTAVELWRNTDGALLTTTKQYDDAGNVLSSVDPLGNRTSFSFTDSWSNSTCAPSGQGKAYLTQTTNALSQVTTRTYDSCTALTASHTDANQQTTSFGYDLLGRTLSVTPPAPEGATTFTYTDTPGSLSVQKQQVIGGSSSTNEYDLYDGLGRAVSHVVANGQATPYDKTDTCYDLRELKSFVSYPYQTSTWNSWPACPISQAGDSYAYDALERTTSVTHSDSTSITHSYAGRATSVMDEGNGTRGVQKISQVDGLGRLVSACEVTATALSVGADYTPSACGQDISATGFLTTYSYDALNSLISVVQGSSLNQRTFTYDSLSHLITAANPESGTTCYGTWNSSSKCIGGYDSDGNAIYRTRPAPNQSSSSTYVTTTYAYDALNRLHTKTYSDGTTPSVTLNYDETSVNGNTLTNTTGRLSSEYTGPSSAMTSRSIVSYNAPGWIVQDIQCTPVNCPKNSYFTFNYGYDGMRDVTSSSNGNGITYTLSYSTAPRLTEIATNWISPSASGNLIKSLQYNAFGEPTSAGLYNNIAESWGYDTRGRVQSYAAMVSSNTRYSLSNITYSGNNNILSATDTVNGTWSSYTYDDFNRLIGSSCTAGCPGTGNQNGLAFSYVYDRYGNRWQQNVTKGTGGQPQYAFDANNRIVASGFTYDAAGNIINDSVHTYTYDAENRIVKVDTGTTAVYTYDTEGRRVAKTAGSANYEYLFDLGGRAVTELVAGTATTNRTEAYAGGRHLATQNVGLGTSYFIHGDWLGTERARTNIGNTVVETCTSLPYGDALSCTGTDVSPLHFTGKMHDTETRLDEFPARYYSSTQGRWYSPDWAAAQIPVPYADLLSPQTLNLYDYVGGDPTNHSDADGHGPLSIFGGPIILTPKDLADIGKGLANGLVDTANSLMKLSFMADPDAAPQLPTPFPNGSPTTNAVAFAVPFMIPGADEGEAEVKGATILENAEDRLASRAQEIEGVLSKRTQGSVTTAVGTAVNADGTTSTLVSTSEGVLRPAQRAALQTGETAVQGQARTHAEVNMLNSAKANGQKLKNVAPSRPACPSCQQTMTHNNVRIIPPQKVPNQ